MKTVKRTFKLLVASVAMLTMLTGCVVINVDEAAITKALESETVQNIIREEVRKAIEEASDPTIIELGN